MTRFSVVPGRALQNIRLVLLNHLSRVRVVMHPCLIVYLCLAGAHDLAPSSIDVNRLQGHRGYMLKSGARV